MKYLIIVLKQFAETLPHADSNNQNDLYTLELAPGVEFTKLECGIEVLSREFNESGTLSLLRKADIQPGTDLTNHHHDLHNLELSLGVEFPKIESGVEISSSEFTESGIPSLLRLEEIQPYSNSTYQQEISFGDVLPKLECEIKEFTEGSITSVLGRAGIQPCADSTYRPDLLSSEMSFGDEFPKLELGNEVLSKECIESGSTSILKRADIQPSDNKIGFKPESHQPAYQPRIKRKCGITKKLESYLATLKPIVKLRRPKRNINPETLECRFTKQLLTKYQLLTCDICDFSTALRINMILHMKRRHMEPTRKPVSCEICGIVVKNPSSLRAHMTIHIEGRERQYRCLEMVCDRQFYTAGQRNVHMRYHLKEKPFKCDQCLYTGISKSKLKIHKERLHRDSRKYGCAVCGKSFDEEDDFMKHKLIHTNPNQFLCVVCGRTFPRYSSFRWHMNIHENYRPYKCSVCDRTYHSCSARRAHEIKIHNIA